jgi:hypothetical protein
VAGDFAVFIMDGNTDINYVGNATVGLGVNDGTPISTATLYGGTGFNAFTEYDVTGALPTDVFQVYGTTTVNNFVSLGGLTFSSAESETPEPGTVGMVIGGFLILAGVARGSSWCRVVKDLEPKCQ